jgi:hypothetical protein
VGARINDWHLVGALQGLAARLCADSDPLVVAQHMTQKSGSVQNEVKELLLTDGICCQLKHALKQLLVDNNASCEQTSTD